jgi:D-3-phosphoglycerate dehydrogenase
MKVLNIEPLRYNQSARELLQTFDEVDYIDVLEYEDLLKVAAQKPYEAIFVKLGLPIDKGLLTVMPSLKYIVTPTTGLNHIDLDSAKENNIEVISLKGETEFLNSIKSTAEHTWMLLLALIRKLPTAFEDVKNYNWRREPFLGSEINKKTLGVIGYGRLGKIVADYGKVFGAKVITHDIDSEKYNDCPEGIEGVSLDELLEKSDIISIHIPADPPNFHFINEPLISKMKPGVTFINTSRGEVVNETALLKALENKSISAAATDVIDGDSSWEGRVPSKHPLIEYARANDNLIITPHIGGYAIESINGTRSFVAKKFIKALKIYS